MQPGVPKALCGDKLKPALEITPVKLSRNAASPDKREFVIKETVTASERAIATIERRAGQGDRGRDQQT
jgi:hypothetical protein